MNRKTKIILLSVLILFAVSVILSVLMLKPSENHNVEIIQDGKIIYTFDLEKEPDHSIVIKSLDGNSSNTITIENSEIFISSAECPDKTCVNMGKLKSENMPIVCLPNRLIIRFCD